MKTIYIIQDTQNRDFSQAVRLGDEVCVVAYRDYPTLADDKLQATHVNAIEHAMEKYDAENDYIVLCGDPVNIGVVFNLAMRKGGGRFLKFDKFIIGYHTITIKGEKQNGKKGC